mgnify:CR=1 FL=1
MVPVVRATAATALGELKPLGGAAALVAVPVLLRYAAVHRDRRNKATHFVGIPVIVFSLLLLPAAAQQSQIDTYTYDANGRRVLDSQLARGEQRLRNLNGRVAPVEKVEEKILSEDSTGRVVLPSSTPSRSTVPASADSSPAMIRNNVVLPHPEGPTIAATSPGSRRKTTLSSTSRLSPDAAR